MKKDLNINILGMHCASCSSLVEISLKNMTGVENISVSLLTGSANVVFDDNEIAEKDIFKIIEDLGYKTVSAGEDEKKKP